MIKFFGEGVSSPEIMVPGWAGSTSDGKCQPWHFKQFTDGATIGIELKYPYEDKIIPEVTPPFTQINDDWYLMEMDLIISTPDKMSLLVIPHYRFYTDTAWETPIPVATMLQTDWWPRLTILFKMPPKGYITKFRTHEPFAQAIVVPRSSLKVEKMTDKNVELNQTANLYIKDNAKKIATRSWVTSSGLVQDNLYEVLCHLENQNKLPEEIKPKKHYKIIKDKSNDALVQNKKTQQHFN